MNIFDLIDLIHLKERNDLNKKLLEFIIHDSYQMMPEKPSENEVNLDIYPDKFTIILNAISDAAEIYDKFKQVVREYEFQLNKISKGLSVLERYYTEIKKQIPPELRKENEELLILETEIDIQSEKEVYAMLNLGTVKNHINKKVLGYQGSEVYDKIMIYSDPKDFERKLLLKANTWILDNKTGRRNITFTKQEYNQLMDYIEIYATETISNNTNPKSKEQQTLEAMKLQQARKFKLVQHIINHPEKYDNLKKAAKSINLKELYNKD
jgi:hypothetical protein